MDVFVWCSALLYLACVLRLLWLDARNPPFSHILPPAQLHRVCSRVMVVHRQHMSHLNATLHSLANVHRSSELRVIVVQPMSASDAHRSKLVGDLLASLQHLPFELTHIMHTSEAPTDFGSNNCGFFVNVLRGLGVIFDDQYLDETSPNGILVMEDNVEACSFLLACMHVNHTRVSPFHRT